MYSSHQRKKSASYLQMNSDLFFRFRNERHGKKNKSMIESIWRITADTPQTGGRLFIRGRISRKCRGDMRVGGRKKRSYIVISFPSGEVTLDV